MEELLGVECGMCHQEAFRTVEREIKVKARVCIQCAHRLDAEVQEQTEAEMLKGLKGPDRKEFSKATSHEWARGWHGKHVVVTYDVQASQDQPAKPDCRIKGRAYYASKHEDVGWGRVKVVLDEAELRRVTFAEATYNLGKWPMVDGYLYGGLEIINHQHYDHRVAEDPLTFYVNWGSRHKLVLHEVDEEAEALAAKREQERLEVERQAEVSRHLGEGI